MKKTIQLIVGMLLLAATSTAQVLRPFTKRYYNNSVRGNIVYVANNIVTTNGRITTENPPGGTAVNNGGVAAYVDIDNTAPTVKLPFGTVWNYHARNVAPANNPAPTDWKQPAYIMPATWNVGATPVAGPGKYGYSSGQATCIPSGQVPICTPAAGNKFLSYYFRNTVSFTALELASTFASIQLNLLRNDGIVVYINGVERIRDNMPGGAVVYGTLASANIAPGAAEAVSYNLSPAFFVAGVNTIAVEVHLRAANSSDMSFDMQVQGIVNSGTFSSSSADLNLPGCSQVLFAGLYWGASQGNDGTNVAWRVGETNVKLKLPGAGTYTTLTSTQTDYHDGTLVPGLPHTGYRCFRDITSLINPTNPNGTYTMADVVGPLGVINGSGGWTIVIVYSNPVLQLRNLTVFDGSAIMNGGDPPLFVGVSGFLTPPSGPVSCELGAVVYDGDRVSTDELSFKQDSNRLVGVYTNQTPNATANLNDMWNSTISYNGASVLTRNPAHLNTLGYDADIITVPNAGNTILGNSRVSASIRFSSPSENYFLHCVTTSISNYNPTFAFEKTATDLNGGAFLPGDSLRYTLSYTNQGNDSSINTVILDNLPSGTAYMPGSIRIGGVSKTDAPGDDQAEYDFANNRIVFRLGVGANAVAGGRVGPGVGSSVDFKVVSASSCKIVSCVGSLRNSARINYGGKISGNILFDSTGVNTSGCIIPGPLILPLAGPCFTPKDTVLVNNCTTLSVRLPYVRYAGYTFYSAQPFIPANIYNQYIPVTTTGVYWAHFTNGPGCSDTARIFVIITGCPDIDDDNDAIPDYVELNNPVALQDANGNGIPNWKDLAYPGYVDNNIDGVNDNFDFGADSDNDGIPNFYDTGFPGFVDTNGDGVNDNADKDKDGIPNQYDLDSDNDAIPDVVESYGVDTNGDGVIDNYVDTDNDGFSQNADANNTGVQGSGNGLGNMDLDGDGIPNYLELDSDNDGIPDVVEASGTDANNNGMIDGFADANSNGIDDNHFLGTGLLFTGPDTGPIDGRADNYPNKNKDRDFRPNAYDMDSDGDGIVDVIEAGLPDANLNGIVDGVIGTNGWSTTVSAMPSLNLRYSDADAYPDYLDIDSDGDGIPDNIEGMSTSGYLLPALVDADGDGLMNPYDNLPAAFGGSGIFVYDNDADGTPDYRDLDTDADGQADIIEGNDFNLNGITDDNVTPTGLDADGDGLDNRFDSLNSVINIKGTSYMMGNGGSVTGDPAPGSRCTVQSETAGQVDRDWRFVGIILPVQFLQLTYASQGSSVILNWTVIATKAVDHFEVERSTDNNNYYQAGTVFQPVKLNEQQSFVFTDDIATVNSEVIYYRIKVIGKAGEIQYSNILIVRKQPGKTLLSIMPNPARDHVSMTFFAEKESEVTIRLIDNFGKTVLLQNQKVVKGNNTLQLYGLGKYSNGIYSLQLFVDDKVILQKLVLLK